MKVLIIEDDSRLADLVRRGLVESGHVVDIETDGERNRMLSILKSRGMAHSNKVHQYVLSDDGIRLMDLHEPTASAPFRG